MNAASARVNPSRRNLFRAAFSRITSFSERNSCFSFSVIASCFSFALRLFCSACKSDCVFCIVRACSSFSCSIDLFRIRSFCSCSSLIAFAFAKLTLSAAFFAAYSVAIWCLMVARLFSSLFSSFVALIFSSRKKSALASSPVVL